MTTDAVHLVPHTHWDREWYEPFQRFRFRLVALLDDVIARAEDDPDFRFTLDGQMAAVDDYLDVRPEQRDRLAALVRGGQLAVGPWQILLDEFLCSGENIIRNLQRGWAGASALGTPMAVGYLPDEFGHCAQMPQILVRAGLRHACVWRGVPADVDTHAFRWEAPDGTSIRTEYLVGGYGNAADVFGDENLLPRRYASLQERLAPWFGDAPVLAMYGTDHAAPLPTLMRDVARLNSLPNGLPVRVSTLAEYVESRDPHEDGLPVVRGELRSHARANILPGVISVRWQLKEALARAERMVERYAEPFAALWAAQWPGQFLDMAWERLVDASCHDSVTGCGVDDTAVQVAARIAEAEHLGQAVRDQVVVGLAASVPADALVVVNPTPSGRTALVTVDVPVPESWADVALESPDGSLLPVQECGRGERLLSDESVDAGQLAVLLRRVHGRELFGRDIERVDVDASATTPTVTFEVAERPSTPGFDLPDLRERLLAAARERPGDWRVRIVDEPRRRLHALIPVPALGWTSVRAVPGTAETGRPVVVTDEQRVRLTNGDLTVDVNEDGTLRCASTDGAVLDGVARIVDGGDRGDTYNYGPLAGDVLVDVPQSVDVRVLERGPLRGLVEVRRGYRWPKGLAEGGGRGAELLPVDVTTRVELRVGEPFVRLQVSFDNPCRDHRVRVHVPTAERAVTSFAEGQLAVVERGLVPEGGDAGEHPVPTYPAHGFVDAGSAGVLLTRAAEFELVDSPASGPVDDRVSGTELAVTLLRGVDRLSRNVHPWRDEPAGPQLETPQAQCLGEATTTLAVLPHARDWHADGLVAHAEAFRHDCCHRRGAGVPGAPLSSAAGVEVRGRGASLTSLRRRGEWLELRVVAESPDGADVTVAGGIVAARRCDLLGRPGDDLDVREGGLTMRLRPWEIATVQLRRHLT